MNESVNVEYKILQKGIKQILGKEPYPEAEKQSEQCKHMSDGFVYNKDVPDSLFATLQCIKCGVQYDVLKSTGEEM